MARLAGTTIGNVAYGTDRSTPMVDLNQGGQFGFQPEYPQLVSSTQYVRRNLIARLIASPRGFNDLPNPEKWHSTLKALVEIWPKTIEGLNAKLDAQFAETAFGAAGEMMQTVSNVTRARSEPTFAYVDVYGRPIATFFDLWMTMLMMDPNTKAPNISTLVNKPVDMLSDYVSMTVLFFEPDPTYTRIDKAFLTANMMPKEGAPVEGKKDPTSEGEQSEFTIPFTGVTQVGVGVNKFAQRLLTEMALTGCNPNQRPAFVDKIEADVLAATTGIADQIAAEAKTAVQL